MSTNERRMISIVVPVFNEADNIGPFHDRMVGVMDDLADRYDFELVFTDNHSTDGTFDVLSSLAEGDPRVRVFRFSRNFGYQRSIWTGYSKARGDAAVQLDVDLQDPPELIERFVDEWEAGNKVVYGIRRSRQEAWHINLARKAFYRIVSLLSEDELPLDAGDFRLVDRVVLDQLRAMEDMQPYLRGAIAALGFEQTGIEYDRAARERGESKFSFGDLLGLSIDAVLNHSVLPLRIASFVGLAVAIATVLGLVGLLIAKLFFSSDWPAGFATTTVLIMLSLSLNAVFLGIIGEYIGRIYRQVKPRPVTVIERSIDR